jgi:hypothetical protein
MTPNSFGGSLQPRSRYVEVRLTKQGVRDLNYIQGPQNIPMTMPVFYNPSCRHRLRRCVPECCGDYYCENCALAFDDDRRKR